MFPTHSIKFSAVVFVFLLLILFQCKKDAARTPTYINPAFGEYISSYTAGSIYSNSPLRIVFTNPAIDSASLGEDAKKYFEFSPSIKGKATWLDL
ncbi:MAG: hypothetical protein ACKO96_42275, partial [Flammeovirgaceae bacterium]